MDRIEENLARTALWGSLAEAFRRPGDRPYRPVQRRPTRRLDVLEAIVVGLTVDETRVAVAVARPRG